MTNEKMELILKVAESVLRNGDEIELTFTQSDNGKRTIFENGNDIRNEIVLRSYKMENHRFMTVKDLPFDIMEEYVDE